MQQVSLITQVQVVSSHFPVSIVFSTLCMNISSAAIYNFTKRKSYKPSSGAAQNSCLTERVLLLKKKENQYIICKFFLSHCFLKSFHLD